MTETAVSTKPAPSAKTRPKKRHSTAHYRVDAERAEILARHRNHRAGAVCFSRRVKPDA